MMRFTPIRVVVVAGGLGLLADGRAMAEMAAGTISVWNGTTATLNFDLAGAGQSQKVQILPNATLAARCQDGAQIAIKTGDRAYAARVACGGTYQLYYDDAQKRYALAVLPMLGTAAPAPGIAEASPLQQVLSNQGAAAANRAAAIAAAVTY